MLLSVVFENPKEIPREGLQSGCRKERANRGLKEALDAVKATISMLNKLGATIQRYSTSSLESRVKGSTEQQTMASSLAKWFTITP